MLTKAFLSSFFVFRTGVFGTFSMENLDFFSSHRAFHRMKLNLCSSRATPIMLQKFCGDWNSHLFGVYILLI